jgi:hypothetical protein
MSFEREYEAVSWTKYNDPSHALYSAKSKFHMRPHAMEFVQDKICSLIEVGDVVLIIGWNAPVPTCEFRAQRDFGLGVLRG